MTVSGKYLQTYGEPEIFALANFPALQWNYCLLIPAYGEPADFVDRLNNGLMARHSVLLIVVINRPDNNDHAEHLAANTQLHSHIRQLGELCWQNANLELIRCAGSASAIVVVDRFSSQRIPPRQGVGMARKIAGDLAATLIGRGQIASPWLFCTDADSHLPDNYFLAAATDQGAALVYPFRHHCEDNDLGQATALYEHYLHHYVDGLKAAGSPYAFHTIGSIMAVHHRHYAMVRGFPKRAGGEDFYLLNKLAKTGAIISLNSPTIAITARVSQRVPFGTGPAVEKILAMTNPSQDFKLHNPKIFEELKAWLATIPDLVANNDALARLSHNSRNLLVAMGVESAIDHCRQHSRTGAGFERQMHTWFDGFRTLKYLQGLRATEFPDIAISELAPRNSSNPVSRSGVP
jgi:hypothetical protein